MSDTRIDTNAISAFMPWLTMSETDAAVRFYQAGFAAVIDDVVTGENDTIEIARLLIGNLTFWVQREAGMGLAQSPMRLIIVTDDPDRLYAQALSAGGLEIAAMHDENGWHIGRIQDPAGYHWEIGKELLQDE